MAIFMAMPSYSVSEAKNQLPRLLDRMLAGEEVVITRRNKPIARLTPEGGAVVDLPRSAHDHAWFDRVRIRPSYPTNSVELLRAMRAEYRY